MFDILFQGGKVVTKEGVFRADVAVTASDYAFHVAITDLDDGKLLSEFPVAAEAGITSFKCFMVYRRENMMIDDGNILTVLEEAKKAGILVNVHAENCDVIDARVAAFRREGKLSPWYHYLSRSEFVEEEADRRAIYWAEYTGAPLYIVHFANAGGVQAVREAKARGVKIYAETCPQYLEFTSEVYKREDGRNFVCSPPMKGEASREALAASGCVGSEENRIGPDKCAALLELHIEQGPVLEAEKKDIGVVEGVCGMINYEFTFVGQADHAGATPMKYRKDALYAACKVIGYLHEEFDKLDKKLVYTTGKISCHPNIHTIIPDLVKFTLDARHQDPAVVRQCIDIIKRIPSEVEKCAFIYAEAWSRATVAFHKPYADFVEESAKELGYPSMRMYSGPGHDAQFAAEIVPTTMIFVPSDGGHSHCELEHTPVENCKKGADVLLNTVLKIDAAV